MASEPFRQEPDQIPLRKRSRSAAPYRRARYARSAQADAGGTAWADDRLRAYVPAGGWHASAIAHSTGRRNRGRRPYVADIQDTFDLFARLAGVCAHHGCGVAGVVRLATHVSPQARAWRHRIGKRGEAAGRLSVRGSAARG